MENEPEKSGHPGNGVEGGGVTTITPSGLGTLCHPTSHSVQRPSLILQAPFTEMFIKVVEFICYLPFFRCFQMEDFLCLHLKWKHFCMALPDNVMDVSPYSHTSFP